MDIKSSIFSRKLENIDYKDAYFLRRFLNSQGKIYPPKKFGLSTKHQRNLATAIKRARFMGLIPYVIK
ncbi:MAG: 30S ribosomal protein S18 [Candidatus Moraniibacteriota bacterium]